VTSSWFFLSTLHFKVWSIDLFNKGCLTSPFTVWIRSRR